MSHPVLNQLITDGVEAYQRSEFQESEVHFRAALTKLQSQTDDIVKALVLHVVATFFYDRGNYSEAINLLKSCIELKQRLLPPFHFDLGDLYEQLAVCYAANEQWTEANNYFERCIENTDQPGLASYLQENVANVLIKYGASQFKQGLQSEGEKQFERAFEISAKVRAKEGHRRLRNMFRRSLADRHCEAAKVYRESNCLSEACSHLQAAISLYEDNDHVRASVFAAIMMTLAEIFEMKGQSEEAKPLRARSEDILNSSFEPDYPPSLNHFIGIYGRQCVQVTSGKLSPIESLTSTLKRQVFTAMASKSYAQAELCLRMCLEMEESIVGPFNETLAPHLAALMPCTLKLQKFHEAEELLVRQLRIGETAAGKNHYFNADKLMYLAGVYIVQGKHAEALALCERALAICDDTLELDSVLYSDSRLR